VCGGLLDILVLGIEFAHTRDDNIGIGMNYAPHVTLRQRPHNLGKVVKVAGEMVFVLGCKVVLHASHEVVEITT